MRMMPQRSCLLLALVLLAPPTLFAQAPVGDTVSVPIANGDSATVTGMLAIRHRGARQFLVIESPTPYHLVRDAQSGAGTDKVIRDMPISLAGHDAELLQFSGQTVSAKGHLRFEPAATSWNGALLESSVVVLPDGKELHAKKH